MRCKLRCNVSLAMLDGAQIDAREDRLQLAGRYDDVLAIAGSQWPLETTSLQSLHPNRQAIAVPVHDLDSVAAQVEEDEQTAFAHVASQVALDDPKEPIKTFSHIDGAGVQEDRDLRV